MYDRTTLRLRFELSLGPYPGDDPTRSPAEHRRVTAIAVTPDGTAVIAADHLGHLRQWSSATGAVLWSRSDVPVTRLAVSPDGRRLATLGSVTTNSDPKASFGPGLDWPDADLLLTHLTLWDLPTHASLLVDSYPETFDDGDVLDPREVTFSPDSSLLAAAFNNSGVLAVYDARAAPGCPRFSTPSRTSKA